MDPALDYFIKDVISVLWGLNMEIGQSCRTIRECQALAQDDPTVKTSMVETRFLIGDHELYRKLWDSVRKNVLKKKRSNSSTPCSRTSTCARGAKKA